MFTWKGHLKGTLLSFIFNEKYLKVFGEWVLKAQGRRCIVPSPCFFPWLRSSAPNWCFPFLTALFLICPYQIILILSIRRNWINMALDPRNWGPLGAKPHIAKSLGVLCLEFNCSAHLGPFQLTLQRGETGDLILAPPHTHTDTLPLFWPEIEQDSCNLPS